VQVIAGLSTVVEKLNELEDIVMSVPDACESQQLLDRLLSNTDSLP
jgi:hypothetical protein